MIAKKVSIFLISVLFFISAGFSKSSFTVAFDYENNKPTKIILNGLIDRTVYLGVSLYSAEVKDPIADGYHLVKEIKPGPKDSFNITISLTEPDLENYRYSYELAFWGKKILAKDCKIKDCYWCKTRGYHLDELIFYKTGYFNTILSK
ncbi:MAG: hypothetical protein ABIK10_04245 [candidate division WOR-3 bacterium]